MSWADICMSNDSYPISQAQGTINMHGCVHSSRAGGKKWQQYGPYQQNESKSTQDACECRQCRSRQAYHYSPYHTASDL